MTAIFEDNARGEYLEAVEYSEAHFDLGAEFIAEVEAKIRGIQADPARYRQVAPGIHRVPLLRFPYSLFYGYRQDISEIIIYALAHHSREPNYWMPRRSST